MVARLLISCDLARLISWELWMSAGDLGWAVCSKLASLSTRLIEPFETTEAELTISMYGLPVGVASALLEKTSFVWF